MKRGDLWRDPLPGSIIPWMFVATFLVIPAIFARLEPLALVATFVAGAMAFSPTDSRPRQIGLILLPIAGLVSLLPVVPSSAVWQVALLFGALTIIATDIAREQGIGVPILRFVRSRKVQGWAAVLGLTPLVTFNLFSIERSLANSGLHPVWRWSVLPLALLSAAPARWFGGPWRTVWGAIPFVVGFFYADSHPRDKAADSLLQVGMTPFWTLAFADSVHEGWAKIRPRRQKDPIGDSRPIRVHSGTRLP